MKGRNTFSSEEIEAVKKLIIEKLKASPDKQKGIRQKIRDIGFYYSDFSSKKDGYNVEDFESLIRSGAIKIVENNLVNGNVIGITGMKEHLIRLLLEQYKQECLFEELEERGIHFGNICVNNLDIILDIIGFPRDNTLDYDFLYLNSGGEQREEGKRNPDDDMFCRDWLDEKYFEASQELSTQQKILVTDKGLKIEKGAGLELVVEKLSEYIDWLYSEFANLNDK